MLSLFKAIRSKKAEKIIEILINNGNTINARDKYGQTPLHYALFNKLPQEIIEFLINRGADVNAKDKESWTPLYYAIGFKPQQEIIELLINRGADVNAKGKYKKAPLHFAIYYKLPQKVIEFLIKRGANVNTKDKDGLTLLHTAIYYKLPQEIIELLINRGANVNAKDKDGQTPLHIACFELSEGIIKLLINSGENINDKNENKQTPLHFAIYKKLPQEIIELLINRGANVNAKGKYKKAPLHFAIYYKLPQEIIELLIKRGSDINAKDKNNWTPLHFAFTFSFYDTKVIVLLLKYKAKNEIHFTDQETNSFYKYLLLIYILIMKIRIKNKLGKTRKLIKKKSFENLNTSDSKKFFVKNEDKWKYYFISFYHNPDLSFLTFKNTKHFTFELVSIYQYYLYSSLELDYILKTTNFCSEVTLKNGRKIKLKNGCYRKNKTTEKVSTSHELVNEETYFFKRNKNGWTQAFIDSIEKRNETILPDSYRDYFGTQHKNYSFKLELDFYKICIKHLYQYFSFFF